MTKILNLDRLNRKFRRLPEVARTHIRAEMQRVAEEIVAMMKRLVAVDDGTLRDSIGWTWGKAPKGSLAVASVTKGGADAMTITIYAGNAEAYYARWVEFGTSPHANGGLFKGSKNPGTSARPFFYVSWRAGRKRARRGVNKALRDSARKVAAGG